MNDVTRILNAIERGNTRAADELLPLVNVERLETDLPIKGTWEDILSLDEALNRLSERNPSPAEAIKLYYFTGLTMEQVGEVQGISHPTVMKYLVYGRAWLNRELSDKDDV